MSDLKNNPHYQHGVFMGMRVSKDIGNTSYSTIEVALERKRELVERLKKLHGDKHKDVAETLGIIAALEQVQESKTKLSK